MPSVALAIIVALLSLAAPAVVTGGSAAGPGHAQPLDGGSGGPPTKACTGDACPPPPGG